MPEPELQVQGDVAGQRAGRGHELQAGGAGFPQLILGPRPHHHDARLGKVGPQGERLLDRATHSARASGQSRPGDVESAVAVAVAFHDGPHLRPAEPRATGADVVAQRAQVDGQVRAHAPATA